MIDALPDPWWRVGRRGHERARDRAGDRSTVSSAATRTGREPLAGSRPRRPRRPGARAGPPSSASAPPSETSRTRRRPADARRDRGVHRPVRRPRALPGRRPARRLDARRPAPRRSPEERCPGMDLTALAGAHLDARPGAHVDVLAPFDDEELRRQVSPLMSPLVWDLAHIGALRGAVAAPPAPRSRRRPPTPASTTSTTRSGTRAANAPACRSSDRTPPAAYAADVRARVLDVLGGLDLGRAPAGPRRVRVRHGRAARASAPRDDARHDRAHGSALPGRPAVTGRGGRATPDASANAEVSLPGGPFVMGTDDEPWAYDNERPAHLGGRRAVPHRRTPVTNDGVPSVRRRRRLRRHPSSGQPTGWAWRTEARPRAPQGWRREGERQLERAPLRSSPGPRRRRAGASTSAGTRPRRSPRGPASGCPPRPNGSTPRPGPRRREAPLSVGQRRSDTVRRASLGREHWARRRSTPTRAARARTACWRWWATSGSGPATPFHGYPGFVSFPYREYSEVFFGDEYRVLRGGSWATHPSACPDHVPQLGLPDPAPDLLRLPLRPRRLTVMCRHLAYLGRPVAPSPSCSSTLRTAWSPQARHPRWQTSGKDNPDGYGVAWWTTTTDTAPAAPVDDADLGGPDLLPSGTTTRAPRCSPRPGSPRRAPRSR